MIRYQRFILLLGLLMYALIADVSTMSKVPKKSYKVLQKTQQFINDGNFKEANATIHQIAHRLIKGSQVEKSYIHSMYGYLFVMDEEVYDQAIDHFHRVLELDAIEQVLQQSIRYGLASIYLEQQSYTKAIKLLKAWTQHAKSPNHEIDIAIANSYIALKEYKKALPYAQKALALNFGVDYLEVVFIIHYSLNMYDAAIDDLYQLLTLNPYFKRYYPTMVSLLLEQKRAKEAMAVLESGYRLKTLEPSLIVQLSILIYQQKAPYRAAAILQQAIKRRLLTPTKEHYLLLESYYTEAKEFDQAIKIVEQSLRRFRDDDIRLKLAKKYFYNEQYSKSVKLLQKLLKNHRSKSQQLKDNKLKKEHNKQYKELLVLLAQNYYELEQYNKAIAYFAKVNDKHAKSWIRYIKRLL